MTSRRSFLRLGAHGLAGLSLADVFRLQAHAKGASSDMAVILYWMAGGPSQLETFDPKPDAPAEVRGPFGSTATRVPGVRFSEMLPKLAAHADHLAVVRSLRHQHSVHDDASHWVQTGQPLLNARQNGQQFPAQGSVVAALRHDPAAAMPAYVCIPQAYSNPLGFYQKAAFLGPRFDPTAAGGVPYRGVDNGPDLRLNPLLDEGRLTGRAALLSDMAGQPPDAFQAKALDMLRSPAVRAAFDLSRVPAKVRDGYGRHLWGQAALMARRLVEAGVKFVTINHYEADTDWWDDHTAIEKNMRKRLPLFDGALAALIADLRQTGLDRRVLVVAVGEFGRSPRIDAQAGRGHWPGAFSAMLFGAGVPGGRVVGATTANAGEPKDRPLGPADLVATIYKVLGIDPHMTIDDKVRRPVKLVEGGEPIAELFA